MKRSPQHLDIAVTAVIAALAAAGAALGPAQTGARVVAMVFALAQALPLLVRRQRPVAALSASTVIVVAGGLLNLGGMGSAFAPLVASYAVGAYGRTRDGFAVAGSALLLGLGGSGLVITTGRAAPSLVDSVLAVAVVHALAYLMGRIMRARRELAAQRTVQALHDQRALIARELHDVVAHHVGAMVIQAAAAQRVLDQDPQRAREALRDIETAGREALEAMPVLLGALRDRADGTELAPAVSLAAIDALIEGGRRMGLTVTLKREGDERRLPPAVDLSAYRLVQEALTNAAKHAGPAHVSALLRYERDALVVRVQDDGKGPDADFSTRGHGLRGMRERTDLLGGSLEVGPVATGGFAVEARFPLNGTPR